MEEIIDLTVRESSEEGRVVGYLFYQGVLDCLLTRKEYSGCPNDAMRHSLQLRISHGDLEAFFAIIEPIFIREDFYRNGFIALKRRAGLANGV